MTLKYEPNELDQMNLTQLASIVPQTAQEEELLKLKFEQRARIAPILIIRNVDVKFKWEEDILTQVLADRKSEIPDENPVQLPPRDQGALDSAFITKEKELELQAKLDAVKGKTTDEPAAEINVLPIIEEPHNVSIDPIHAPLVQEPEVKKVTKTKKK